MKFFIYQYKNWLYRGIRIFARNLFFGSDLCGNTCRYHWKSAENNNSSTEKPIGGSFCCQKNKCSVNLAETFQAWCQTLLDSSSIPPGILSTSINCIRYGARAGVNPKLIVEGWSEWWMREEWDGIRKNSPKTSLIRTEIKCWQATLHLWFQLGFINSQKISHFGKIPAGSGLLK